MTLKYKLTLGAMLLTATGIFATSQFFYRLSERTLREDLESRGTMAARQFITQYGESLRRRNEAELLKGLMVLLKNPDITDCSVAEMDGKVIAHTDIQQE